MPDLPLLEWARFAETRLAPQATDEVRAHLEGCASCREKVEAFGALERSMHAYGTLPPVDPVPKRFRRGLVVVVMAAVLAAAAFLVLSR